MIVTDTAKTSDGRNATIERYEARERPGAPTGFSGSGYVVKVDGSVVFQHAWRVFALEYLATLR
jgi:hypothetical protein